MERLLTPTEVAELLRVSPLTVFKWLRAGKLKGFKAGRLWRVWPADLEEFIARGTEPRREREGP